MITTGKNLAEIIGELGTYVAERDNVVDEQGHPKEVVHVSANPKYGSEKKGAPTEYFMTAAPERVRVNCDLRHVNVVLCCDPKAFTHINPIDGLVEGGAFVWESAESPGEAWQRIPQKYRQEIIEKKIRVFILPGFNIAKKATNRPDLQLRMQGNSFLGAFFKVSPFLKTFNIDEDHFKGVVRAQYNKKFGNSGVFSPDAYEGEGSGDANSVLANGMTAGEEAAMNAAAIMGGTGQITKSNNKQTSKLQNPEAQSISGLNGINTLRETMRKHFQNAAEAERLF